MPPPYALGFDAASYLISAFTVGVDPASFPQTAAPREFNWTHIGTDIAEGLRFLWHQPVIRTLTLSVFCACLGWGGTFGCSWSTRAEPFTWPTQTYGSAFCTARESWAV